MDTFNLPNVPYYTQRDNVYQPYTSCFPTSLAMCMRYCLDSIEKTKKDVGCADSMQLEDYIFQMLECPETKAWVKANISILGVWVLNYAPRYVYTIEEYIFNRLMTPLGFKASFKSFLTYNDICNWIEKTQLPVVLGGDFSSVSKVAGHMNCITGFNKIGMPEFIVNDPFGNALKGYSDINGQGMRYSYRFYVINKLNQMNGIFIEKTTL